MAPVGALIMTGHGLRGGGTQRRSRASLRMALSDSVAVGLWPGVVTRIDGTWVSRQQANTFPVRTPSHRKSSSRLQLKLRFGPRPVLRVRRPPVLLSRQPGRKAWLPEGGLHAIEAHGIGH